MNRLTVDRNLDIVPISQQVERVQHREREAAVSEFLLRSDLLEDLVPVDIALPYQQCSIFEIAFSVSDRLEQEDIGQRQEMENQAVELWVSSTRLRMSSVSCKLFATVSTKISQRGNPSFSNTILGLSCS